MATSNKEEAATFMRNTPSCGKTLLYDGCAANWCTKVGCFVGSEECVSLFRSARIWAEFGSCPSSRLGT